MTPPADPMLLRSPCRVRVGSTNEPKLAAVRSAFAAYVADVEVSGVRVESGVSEQPLGFEEIVRGARNRAARACEAPGCDVGVGIEDGLVVLPIDAELRHLNVGCAAITRGGRTSVGFSSAFAYPPGCADRAVQEREPIGALFDRLWQERTGETAALPSARTTGNVGRLTGGVLTRAEYARHAVLCALVPLLHPDLYEAG